MAFQYELIKRLKTYGSRIAIDSGSELISYDQLNQQANRITSFLLNQHLPEGTIIGVRLDEKTEIIYSIIGVINARCVFVMLDGKLPENRLNSMMDNLNLRYVISNDPLDMTHRGKEIETFILKDILAKGQLEAPQYPAYHDEDSLYIYFTSGSTGIPKGIVGKNCSLLQFVRWEIEEFKIAEHSRFSQFISPYFDAFLRDIFVPLIAGGTICIPPDEVLVPWIDESKVNYIHCVPTLFRVINSSDLSGDNFTHLKCILMSGEKIVPSELTRWYNIFETRIQLVNLYGATESTMIRSFYRISPDDVNQQRIAIGYPIHDTELLIVNGDFKPCSPLVPGSLYIVSKFLTKGYLNAPELTNDKFIKIDPGTENERIAYKTGDIARMLPSGKIDLIGREDRQVKLRGIRIELDEVESVLMKVGKLKSATSMIYTDEEGIDTLVAFVVPLDNLREEPNLVISIQEFLEINLPQVMIPSTIIVVDSYPLLTNGKIDFKALRELVVNNREIVLPSTELEERILTVWREILGQKPISIEDNFTKIGGNSLSVMNLIGKLNRNFQVKFSLAQLFENLTIVKQAEFIEKSAGGVVNIISKSGTADYYVLSSAQKRLYFLYQFDSSSLAYNMPQVVRLEGDLDLDRVEFSINRLLERHESLRTSFHIVDEQPVQKVESSARIQIERAVANKDFTADNVQQFLRPFDLSQAPLLRVALTKTSPNEHVLMFDMHHIIADGVSHSLLIKDFMKYYNNEVLPELKLQYRDFAVWQQSAFQQRTIARQRKFWIDTFADLPDKIDLPADFPRGASKDSSGASAIFSIERDEMYRLREIAIKAETSMFTVILSIFNIFISKITGKEDLVIGSPFAGRHHDDLEHVIGMFVNTLPLRNRVKSASSFSDFLFTVKSVVASCIANQDYPYEELIDALNIDRDTNRNPLFDIMLAYQNFAMSELDIDGVKVKPFYWESKAVKFDLTLFAFELEDKIVMRFEYATALFERSTIDLFIEYFRHIVLGVIENPETVISDLSIVPDAQAEMFLNTFNTSDSRLQGETVVSLFENRVTVSPDQAAFTCGDVQLTYNELNEHTNKLSHFLRNEHNLHSGDLVGIMVSSPESVLVSMLAILKSGCAFVPITAKYTSEQTTQILNDSGIKILLVDANDFKRFGHTVTAVDISLTRYYRGDGSNIHSPIDPETLCYIQYAHRPGEQARGLMFSHGNVVNGFLGLNDLHKEESRCLLPELDITEDSVVLDLFWALSGGIEVVVPLIDKSSDNPLEQYISNGTSAVDFSLFFFSSYNNQEEDKYGLLFDSVRYADENGFKAVWTPERHFHEFGGLYPNPSVISAALAMSTSQIELRCGSIVSPLHDSIRIAEEWSVVDNFSNGRIGLSFGSGWNVNDFVLSPLSFAERQRKMYDQIEEVRKLWKGERLKRTNGLGNEVEVGVFPRPIQNEPPVWITSSRSEETFRSAGSIGANILTHLLGHDIDDLANKIAIYRAARGENGHDINAGKVTVMLHTYIGNDIEEVERTVQQPFMDYLKSAIGLDKIMMEESGLREDEIAEEDKEIILKNAFARYYQKASLIGTKANCIQTVEKLRRIGVDEIACLIDFGIERDAVLRALENLNDLRDYFARKDVRKQKVVKMMCSTQATITRLEALAGAKEYIDSLRLLVIGGGQVSRSFMNRMAHDYKVPVFFAQGYHAAICSFIYKLDKPSSRLMMGKAVPNMHALVLDEDLNLVPIGIPGNLFIAGAGLSKGYWKSAEYTAMHFIPNPFASGSSMYRTGDKAKWLPSGNLEYLGVRDNELKSEGYVLRSEEIAFYIAKHQHIVEATVVTSVKDGVRQLTAYYVAKVVVDPSEVRDYLLTVLPENMVPAFFIQVSSIPRNTHGEVELTAVGLPEHSGGDQKLMSSEILEKLVAIWAEVLKVDKTKIDLNSSFFRLGGHSLRALVVVNKIYKEMGVKVPLKSFFLHSTIMALGQFIQLSKKSDYLSIKKSPLKDYYAISDAQRAMYFLHEFDKSSLFYNQPRVLKISGNLDTDLLQDVFFKIVDRHEIFRTSFEVVNDEPVQIVAEQVHFEIEVLKAPEQDVKSILENSIRPFDLNCAPLLRVILVEAAPTTHYLMIDTHHIILDGTSDGIFVQELAALYNRRELPEMKLQYKDFAEWQQGEVHMREIERKKGFWIDQFADGMPIVDLPVDFHDPVPMDQKGGSVDFELCPGTARALKAVGERQGATTYTLILALYNVFLAKIANQEDILIGTLVSGREHVDIENMLGMFVMALPLRNNPNGDFSFMQFLETVKNNTLSAFENQSYEFKAQVNQSSGRRGLNRGVPFNVFYTFRNFERTSGNQIEGLVIDEFYAGGIGESRYDINLVASETDYGILLTLNFSNLFKEDTRARFANYFSEILDHIITNPEIRICDILLVTKIEKHRIFSEFNASRKSMERDKSFYQLFAEQVERTPNNTAAEHHNQLISYQTLHEECMRFSSYLMKLNVNAGQKVALFMPRGIEMLTSILSILRVGSAYVPMDVDYPKERIKDILLDSEVAIVLTTDLFASVIKDAVGELATIREIAVVDFCNFKEEDIIFDIAAVSTDTLAYVIYTSGTSGKPKGVMIHQLGMLNHIQAKIGALGMNASDVIAQTASACFDISVWQFLAPLLCGARTCIIDKETVLDPEQILYELRQKNVSIFESVPSLLTTFLDKIASLEEKTLPLLRWMIPTGESLPASVVRRWYSIYPDIKLLNAYGPTEASDDVTHHVVPMLHPGQSIVPIGKPVQNTHIYVLDKYMNLCPISVKGEIYVAGLGVGKGYWKNGERTAKAFIPNPWRLDDDADAQYETLFKTGDVGYYLEDGCIVCLGRIDEQVKIRGLRIELGEIENILLEKDDIKEAAVVTHLKDSHDRRLAAFVVPGNPSLTSGEIRQFLKARLPDYMVPSWIIKLERMPLTTNDKTDKKALHDKLSFMDMVEENYVEPGTEIEKQLAQVWRDVLGVEVVGSADTFFDLGGHSLLLIKNNQRVKNQFKIELPFKLYFSHTLQQIASEIETRIADKDKELVENEL